MKSVKLGLLGVGTVGASTAKVLKLSNSTFYGRPKNVNTLEEAIMILGFFTVQSMVVATSAHSMYTKDDAEGYKAKLWRHSFSSAVAAKTVDRRACRRDRIHPRASTNGTATATTAVRAARFAA